MKTSVGIPDSLLAEVRHVAAKEGTTVRDMVERGLRLVLAERNRSAPFHLRKVTFKGSGLQPGVKEASWDHIRDLIYEERGE